MLMWLILVFVCLPSECLCVYVHIWQNAFPFQTIHLTYYKKPQMTHSSWWKNTKKATAAILMQYALSLSLCAHQFNLVRFPNANSLRMNKTSNYLLIIKGKTEIFLAKNKTRAEKSAKSKTANETAIPIKAINALCVTRDYIRHINIKCILDYCQREWVKERERDGDKESWASCSYSVWRWEMLCLCCFFCFLNVNHSSLAVLAHLFSSIWHSWPLTYAWTPD